MLAPYNSSRSELGLDSQGTEVSVYSKKGRVISFKNGKMKELDREYEANNNQNMDNGVFNTEEEKAEPSRQNTGMSHGYSLEIG